MLTLNNENRRPLTITDILMELEVRRGILEKAKKELPADHLNFTNGRIKEIESLEHWIKVRKDSFV
jgi:hypothetical protein